MTRVCLLILTAASAIAQPGIGQNGVVNSASQMPPTLPGGALAPGARFSIYGVRLGSSAASTQISAGPMQIKATSITPTRIEATLPANAAPGTLPLVVTVNGMKSKPFPIHIVPSNPGIYSKNGLGWGPAVASTVRPGQRVAIATTGLGNATQLTVVIGGRSVPVARTAGADELTFPIPASVPEGCQVPVYIQAAPHRASNVVTLAISRSGMPCNAGPLAILSKNSVGVAILARSRMLGRNATSDAIDDEATAVFASRTGQPSLSPMLLLPPPGTCTAYTSSFQATTALPNSVSSALAAELEARGLEAGSVLKLRSKSGERTVSRVRGSPGYFRSKLGSGGASAGPRTLPLFFEPGEIEIEAVGGEQLGPFRARMKSPPPFEWTNRAETAVIDRSRPLTLKWRGMSNDRLALIFATNTGQLSTAIGTCLCTVRASAGRFTIPAELLANIPESVEMPGIPYDQLFLVSLPETALPGFEASGIDAAALLNVYSVGRIVQYK